MAAPMHTAPRHPRFLIAAFKRDSRPLLRGR
jgi:hypothetical protein